MSGQEKVSRRRYLKYLVGAAAAAIAIGLGYYYWPKPRVAPKRKSVKLGHSSAFTGVLATAEAICRMHYDLWTEMVNAEGGLYLKEYDRKLPVSWVFYNDMGETERYIRNLRRLIEEDKVDAIYGSYGTFQSFAAYPIVNQYDVLCVAGNATAALIERPEEFVRIYKEKDYYRDEKGRPWYEWSKQIWNETHRYWHIEALVKVLKQVGVSDVVIWEIGTLYGIESRRHFMHLIKDTGIKVLSHKVYPLGQRDFTPLISEAKSLNPDAVIQFSYPDDGMAAISDMIKEDYNPNLYYNALGSTCADAYERFGENLEGIMYHGWGAFPKGRASKSKWGSGLDIVDKFVERYNARPDMVDGACAFMAVQVIGELIERAGTLDHKAIFEQVLKTKDNPLETIAGPVYWDRGPWPEYPGTVGQMINIGEVPMGHDSEIVAAAFGDTEGFGLSLSLIHI